MQARIALKAHGGPDSGSACGSKATVAVGHLCWRDVEPQAALAAKLCDTAPAHLQ